MRQEIERTEEEEEEMMVSCEMRWQMRQIMRW